jgi:hypothetical protein
LQSNVASEEHRNRRVELFVLKAKVFLDALYTGVWQSLAI